MTTALTEADEQKLQREAFEAFIEKMKGTKSPGQGRGF